MKITQEQANARLNSGQNAINIIHKQLYADRAKSQNLKIAPDVRSLIGICSNRDGSRETAANFGVSHTLAVAAANGKVFRGNHRESELDPQIADKVQANLKSAKAEAISRALAAMQSITEDKLAECDAKDSAAIANHMASVYDKLTNKQAAISGSGATVIIYSPREKKESEFDSIDIEAHVAS